VGGPRYPVNAAVGMTAAGATGQLSVVGSKVMLT
jgi:hypothetical protein